MIPFLQVQPKSMKLKVSPRFPAQLLGGTGISVVKQNGNYSINLDYAEFPPATSLPAPISNQYALGYDIVQNKYTLVPASVLGGGITDAPSDGNLYGRESGAWVAAQPQDADLAAIAALSGTGIARRTAAGTWSVGTAVANGELAPMPMNTLKGNATTTSATPSDVDISTLTLKGSPAGSDFLLLSDQAASGALKKITIGSLPGASGGIPEAPNDGQQYGRQSLGWTVITGGGASPSNALPIMDGTASAGTATLYARGDHVHPTDTSRAPLASPALTGTPTAPTPANADNSTKIATTAWVQTNAPGTPPATALPLMNGTAAVGVATKYAREDHVHPTDTSRAPLASPAFTGTPTAPTPTAGDNSTNVATTAFVQGVAHLSKGYLFGCGLLAGLGNNIQINAGEAVDSTGAALMVLPSTIVKSVATWAAGNNNGGVDSGVGQPNTWYHVFLIKNLTTNTVDALLSASPTAPTLPSGYTVFRRVGAGKTNGSTLFYGMTNFGDDFYWSNVFYDVSVSNPGTAAVLRTLSVPTGIAVLARFNVLAASDGSGSADGRAWITCPATVDEAANNPQYNAGFGGMIPAGSQGLEQMVLRTNTSAQVRTRFSASTTNTYLSIGTVGWIDPRGRWE